MNFSALLDAWLAETGSRVKRSTLATYERALERCIRPALGALDTEQMTDAELTKFLIGAAEVYSGSTVRLRGGPALGAGIRARARPVPGGGGPSAAP